MKHSRFSRFVSGTLIVAFMAASTEAIGAQQATPPTAPASAGSVAEGQRDAELLADTIGTGGKVAGGVVVGLFTGLIGTSIGYFVIGPQDLSAEAALAQQAKTPEYQLGFKNGWAKKTKDKKRKSFLVGGLLGTAAWVAILIKANSSQQ